MDEQGQGGVSQKSGEFREIARKVDSLIRSANGLEHFREQTQQAAAEHLAARCECQRREEQRLDLLKKSGVLASIEDLPKRPVDDKTELIAWSQIIRGRIEKTVDIDLPIAPKRPDYPDEICGVPTKDLTDKQRKLKEALETEWIKASADFCLAELQLVRNLGFPNDTKVNDEDEFDYYEYAFDLHGWIPVELLPDHDPNLDLPLPVPKRELKPAEKFAGLSALFDAWFSGAEKIAPWGTEKPNKAEVLSGLKVKDQFQQANWYWLLVHTAKELDVDEIPILESWLADVESNLPDTKPDKKKKSGKRRVTADAVDCGRYVKKELRRDPGQNRFDLVKEWCKVHKSNYSPYTINKVLQQNPNLWKPADK